jgi:hypothetical protein
MKIGHDRAHGGQFLMGGWGFHLWGVNERNIALIVTEKSPQCKQTAGTIRTDFDDYS